jgi:hypothetical protein
MPVDMPFDKVAAALRREAVEAVPRVDLCADLVLPLLLGVVVAAFAVSVPNSF